MAKTRTYHDSIVIAVPEAASPLVDGVLVADRVRALITVLTDEARTVLAAQYPHSTLLNVDWTFATEPEHVSAWPLPHDCANCREGVYKAIASLTIDPDRMIALGDMTCQEPVRG